MKAFSAIVKLTCRAALRSFFLRGLVIFLFIALLLLPFLLHTDGTAAGWIKINLEYSFSLTVFILALSSVWLGASVITEDVVDARLHLIVTKPVSRITVFFAKYCGVLLIHGVVLAAAAMMIYGLTLYRIGSADFEEGEREKLKKEVLAGRRIYAPDPIEETVNKEVTGLMDRLQREAEARGEKMPKEWVTVRDRNNEFSLDEVRRRYADRIRTELTTAAPRGGSMRWTYSGLPENIDSKMRIRFRIYDTDGTTIRHTTYGVFGWAYHAPMNIASSGKDWSSKTVFFEPAPGMAHTWNTGVVLETEIPVEVRELGDDLLMVKDGKGTLYYENRDNARAHEFMPEYGPYLLVPVTGFFANFCRALLPLLAAVITFAAFGCSFSAMFSLPMGIFLSFVYVTVSLSTRFLLEIFEKTVVTPHGFMEKVGFYSSKFFEDILIDPAAYSPGPELASGELIEWGAVGMLYLLSLIRVLPFMAIAVYVYYRRELALAVKD